MAAAATALLRISTFVAICLKIDKACGGKLACQACCSYNGYRSRDATTSSVTTPGGRAGKYVEVDVVVVAVAAVVGGVGVGVWGIWWGTGL